MKAPFDQQVIFLYTHDLQRTIHFYEEQLALPLVLDQGSCRIYQTSPNGFIGFCERPEAPEKPQGIIITLVTSEVDRWYTQLAEKGVVFEKPPTYNPTYNIYHCFLRDPNGYLLEIQTFLDANWQKNA